MRFLLLCALLLSPCFLSQARAQVGDLPIPPGYEERLFSLGFVERFLPVQADTAVPDAADRERGWLLYRRDRNCTDADFFITTGNDDVEKLRDYVIAGTLKTLEK